MPYSRTTQTNSQTISAFAGYQTGRGWSANTIDRRGTALRSLARHLNPQPLVAATLADIEEWLAGFDAVRTRSAYRSDVRSWAKWACKRHLIAVDPTVDLDPIKIPSALPRPVAADMIAHIIATAPCFDTRLMCALAAYAGLRRAEIAHLEVGHVSLGARPFLEVRGGKGDKDRVVPIAPELARLLGAARRRDGRYFNVSPDTVGVNIANHLRSLGINATAHKLRASFATAVARATNGNVVLTGKLLGHADLKTTMGYIAFAIDGTTSDAVASLYGAVA